MNNKRTNTKLPKKKKAPWRYKDSRGNKYNSLPELVESVSRKYFKEEKAKQGGEG